MNTLEQLIRQVCAETENPSPAMLELQTELAELTDQRLAHEMTIEAARSNYATDDIEIDDDPLLSIADEGVWVSAWVWVPTESEPEEDEPILKCSICGELQFTTPHGPCCKNGHGGADSL